MARGKREFKFFSREEKELIRRAVAEAEQKSAGEIATMVVRQSERYREAEQLGALLVAGLLGVVLAVVTRHVTIWSYIPMVFLIFFPTLWLFRRFPRLKLSFAGKRRQAEAVRERALAAFFEKGLHRTEQETGILIFISVLEQKVWILGDRGINARIPPHYWKSFATDLAAGIRAGESAAALCRTVSRCGAELARHFPRSSGDRNELPDEPFSP